MTQGYLCVIFVIMTKDVRDIAERYDCTLVYLFGSQANKGRRYLEGEYIVPDPSCDLDIAVAFKTPPLEVSRTYASLYKEFSEIFEPFEVDIVFIYEVDALFQYEVIKGVRIYEENKFMADEFEEGVIKKAGDVLYKKMMFDKEIIEAVEDGYFEFEYSPNP